MKPLSANLEKPPIFLHKYETFERTLGTTTALMARQPVGKEDMTSLKVPSHVRGFHAYQDICNPHVCEVLLPLEREFRNPEVKFAVTIVRRGALLAPIVFTIIRRVVNKGLIEVTGTKVDD